MPVLKWLITLTVGLGIISLLCFFAGENSFHVLQILISSSLAQPEDLAVTLFYSTHLMFCAAGLCIAFQTGLFPIGAEGQLSLSCLITTVVALMMPPSLISIVAAVLSGVASSALLGLLVGYFRTKKNAHEVIVTMMLNFLVAGLANYLVSQHFQSHDSQNPETSMIAASYWIFSPLLTIEGAPVNTSLFVAILGCVFAWAFLFKTKLGYEMRTVGLNPSVALNSGISVNRIYILALVLSAAFAGLCSWNQILGYAHKYQIGFSADYGFLAIAVALVARNNPLAVIPCSFFFAILLKGSSDLDIETNFITRDFVKIMQAVLILTFLVLQTYRVKKKTAEVDNA